MAKTESSMVELGTETPAFELIDVVSGHAVGRDDVFSASWADGGATGQRGMLVMFVCVHCPYVKHVEQQLASLGKDYAGRIGIVAVSSNDVEAYPQDGPAEMKAQAERLGWSFPYLYDETQEVARSFGAACTPDFFVYDASLRLVYRGQLDGSRPRRGESGNDVPVTGEHLRRALDEVVAGQTPDPEQRGSLGCGIKWRNQ